MTGGYGFIGSAVIRHLLTFDSYEVLNIDALTYASNLYALSEVSSHARYKFEKLDIRNATQVNDVFEAWRPQKVMHLAAETHVDNSIDGPQLFLETNILGTFNLLEAFKNVVSGESLSEGGRTHLFHHVSTDEVFGDLGNSTDLFSETSPYEPSSPYSASKAASDHLVRAWSRTYDLPVVITNCSNNYGPFQSAEKLIPKVIQKVLSGEPIPVYGNGSQVRDWLYVEDHAVALERVLSAGYVGDTYTIGGGNEVSNLEVVRAIVGIISEHYLDHVDAHESDLFNLISFVSDRPGHDKRYAIDASKINKQLGWNPSVNFVTGLKKTIDWFISNQSLWH